MCIGFPQILCAEMCFNLQKLCLNLEKFLAGGARTGLAHMTLCDTRWLKITDIHTRYHIEYTEDYRHPYSMSHRVYLTPKLLQSISNLGKIPNTLNKSYGLNSYLVLFRRVSKDIFPNNPYGIFISLGFLKTHFSGLIVKNCWLTIFHKATTGMSYIHYSTTTEL